ncbi:T9SS type A sorting domain-containing protein [Faecalibacter bovis]|uniref:T9SS type A sorting domain-containing protein n=1 Tax=Faecalibacter bovis TaxID=2898187 RepID=A0ABX7XFE2_9FLAO|nr:T9SS type A sorting domain-containing protein [Faecalibacter bovis]QTV06319.1 T9SS type A sorting domain-containing protein [Faecalibacter bovis]
MKKLFAFLFGISFFALTNAQNSAVDFYVHDLDKSEGVIYNKLKFGSTYNFLIDHSHNFYYMDHQLKRTTRIPIQPYFLYTDNIINADNEFFRINSSASQLSRILFGGSEEVIIGNVSGLKELGSFQGQKYISFEQGERTKFGRLDRNGFHELVTTHASLFKNSELHDNYFISLYYNKVVVYNILDGTSFTYPFVSTYTFNSSENHEIAYFNNKLYFNTVDVERTLIGLKSNILDLRTNTVSVNTSFQNLYTKIIKVNDKGVFKINPNSTRLHVINPDESIQTVELPYVIPETDFYRENYIGDDRLIIKHNGARGYVEVNVATYTATKHDALEGVSTPIAISGDEIYYLRNNKLYIYNAVTRVSTLYSDELSVIKIFEKNGDEIFINASLPKTGYEMYSINVNTKDLTFYGDANNEPISYPKRFYDINGKTIVLGILNAFVTEGTPQSTRMLESDNNLVHNDEDLSLKVNNNIIFSCKPIGSHEYQNDLCVIDGNNFEFKQLSNDSNNNVKVIDLLAAGATKAYFIGETLQHGKELWVSDGTLNGTRMVKDITLGANSTEIEILYSKETIIGDKFYFIKIYRIGNNLRKELWVSDGTSQGTYKLKDITSLTTSSSYLTAYLVSAKGNNLLFTKRDPNIQNSNLGLYQLNLETLAETKLSNLKDDYGFRDIVVQDDNIYFTEKISIFNNGFSRINARTLEKRIYESSFFVRDDTKTIRDCQDYMLYDDGAFDSQLFVFNNRTNRKLQLPHTYDPYTLTSMCINGRLVLSGNTDGMDSHFVTISDDSFNFHPVTLNGNRYSNRVSLMYYNESTNKMYSRSESEIVEAAGELLITDFDLEPFTLSLANLDDPNKKSLVSIYPNPTSRELFISPKDVTILDYSIYDLTGREIKSFINKSDGNIKIDVSDFLKGIYIINVNTTKGKESKKLIVK